MIVAVWNNTYVGSRAPLTTSEVWALSVFRLDLSPLCVSLLSHVVSLGSFLVTAVSGLSVCAATWAPSCLQQPGAGCVHILGVTVKSTSGRPVPWGHIHLG